MKELPKVITLPADEHRVKQLKAKLVQYNGRNRYAAPEVDRDTFYKRYILNLLVNNGQIFWAEVSREVEVACGWFSPGHFYEAWGIISDYCLTGGANVVNGGLPNN